MRHDRAYDRAKDWTKAIRKYHIDRDRMAGTGLPYYDNLHQYVKGKIHCSCRMCACKTNNKHGRANAWDKPHNWSMMDRKRLDAMKAQLRESEEDMAMEENKVCKVSFRYEAPKEDVVDLQFTTEEEFLKLGHLHDMCRRFAAACGFCEKSIDDLFGDVDLY